MVSLSAKIYRRLPLRREALTLARAFGAGRALRNFYFEGPFTVRIDQTHAFRLCQHNRWDLAETEIFWRGLANGYEHRSIAAWVKLAPRARVVIDVGASEGIYALIAKTLAADARVIALECLPNRFVELERNVLTNGLDIECIQVAASDADGLASFWAESDVSTMGSLLPIAGAKELSVRTVPLGTLLRERNLADVDLLKVDVEGAEVSVLKGLGEFLSRCRPNILVEVLSDEAGAALEALVGDLGYVYYDVNDGKRIRPEPLLKQTHIRKGACLNWLMVRPNDEHLVEQLTRPLA